MHVFKEKIDFLLYHLKMLMIEKVTSNIIVEIKDYNVMIDRRNFFDQPIKNNSKVYDKIRKVATGQGNDYTTGCLLDYPYFKKCYKLIAIDLSKTRC